MFFATLSTAQAQSSTCEFSSPVFLDDDEQVSLEHYINRDDETFTIRLSYSQGHSWIGVGFNALNQPDHTTPTYSVIGEALLQPEDPNASYLGEAYRYYLDTQAEDASGVNRLPDFPGHLKQSTFVQNPVNDAEQISVLQFTHDLVVRNENNFDDVLFTISVPGDNSNSNSNSNNSGGGDDSNNNNNSDGNNDDRLQAPEGRRALQFDNDQFPTTFIWAVGLEENQFMGRHVLHGSFTLNSLGVNFCGDGDVGTDAPSGAPTTNAQSVFNDVFPTPQDENNESSGSGGDNGSGGGGNIDFNDDIFEDDFAQQENQALQDPVAHLWVYHGILMGVAWGIFAPVAILIPVLRKLDFLEFDGRWKSIHLMSSLTVVFLTIAGFALAVMANNPAYSLESDEEKQYFTGNMHYAMGVMILVIMVLQALMGCCIPGDRIDDDDDSSSWSSKSGKDESVGTKDNENNDKKSQASSPLRTMMIDNKVKNEEGEMVPNRTAFRQYLPKRFTPAIQERARKRAESTTVLGTAKGNDSDHRVASLTPRKMEAKSHRLEAIEVVDVPDLDFVAEMNKSSAKNDELVPTKVELEGDDVSELEDPAAEKVDEEVPEKSDFLICWIYTHRLLGLALFGMALYTCHNGIVLQSEIMANSEEED
ncbi:MAG: hypothetical protein SGARI_001252, partial [Bacillariaceae sp.]